MKLSVIFLAFSAFLFAQAPPTGAPPAPPAMTAKPADPNEVVIAVGDQKITAAQYDQLVKTLPQQYQEIARGAGRRQFAQNLVELTALANEAAKRNIDKDPDVALQIAFQKQNLLAQAMFQNLSQSLPVSDADVQAYYDAHKSEYETLTARHILIRVKGAPMPGAPGKPELSDDEAKAKAEAIRKRIQGGEDFAKVAQAESDDTASGAQGGSLGEFKHGMMVPPFEQAAFALKPGEISEPVKSDFGYHIIQVQTHVTKDLAAEKPEILAALRPELARKAVGALVDQTKYTISDSFFGPATSAPAAGPGAPVVNK